MVLDNLEANKEINEEEISDYLETVCAKTEVIAKSTYGLDDLQPVVQILFQLNMKKGINYFME